MKAALANPRASAGVTDLPLHQRDALTLSEAAALGYGSERLLRQMIADGRLKRCVLRIGRRGVRVLRTKLADELGGR